MSRTSVLFVTLISSAIIACCLALSHDTSASPSIPTQEIVDLYSDPSLSVAEKWLLIGKFYNDFAWPHRRKIVHYLKRALNETQLDFSPKCRKSLKLLRKGLQDSTQWAFESEFAKFLFPVEVA